MLNQMAEEKVRHAVERAKHFVRPAAAAEPGAQRAGVPRRETPSDVVIVFALGLESGGFIDQMADVVTTECQTFVERAGQLDGERIVVVETGVGRQAAERATEDAIKILRPQWVISAGFAGALVEPLRRGHILMADSIVDTDHQLLDVGFKIDPQIVATTPSLHVGRLLTVDALIRHREEKEQLAADYDAVACDMETTAVAAACRRRQVRFLAVRVISDGLVDTLPKEIEQMLDQSSLAGKLGAATRAVFHRPGSVKDMWHLRATALRASDRLARFLVGVVPQLERREVP